jgi:membrane-associated phospholipid phosphatase
MAAQDAEHGMDSGRPADRHGSPDNPDLTAESGGLEVRPLIALVCFAVFAVLTWLIASKVVIPFDQSLFDSAQGLGQYMEAWRDLSTSANLPLIAIGVAIVLILLLKKRWREALLVVGVLAAVTVGSELVKQLVARPRPPGFDQSLLGVVYSYPSGHVLEAVTIYGIIAVLVWRSSLPRLIRVGLPIVFTVIIALVAVARVAVGDHYPSDVLAGLVLGIGFVALFSWLTDLVAGRRATSEARGSVG